MIIPPTLQNNMRAVVVYTHKYISYIYIYIISYKLRKKYYHMIYHTQTYIYFFIILLIQENNYQHIQMLFYSN